MWCGLISADKPQGQFKKLSMVAGDFFHATKLDEVI